MKLIDTILISDSCVDPTPNNGFIYYVSQKPTNGHYPDNTELQIECDLGYTITAGKYGSHFETCENGEWSYMFAICVAEDQGECNFLELECTIYFFTINKSDRFVRSCSIKMSFIKIFKI